MVDAREYHERSSHSPRSVREDTHRLDPRTKPRPYKIYEDLPRVRPHASADPTASGDPPASADPPITLDAPDTPALSAIATADPEPSVEPPSSDQSVPIAALCRAATGVTKELTVRGNPIEFRAAACTGKLYHVDLYAVAGDSDTFDPGVYHYDPHEDAFDVLREGDYRGVLAAASGGPDGVANAPVTFVATSTWWRNAWKYRDRTYRHAFWDSGTILANLLATAHGRGYRAEVVTAFADEPVVDLLGVDPQDEAPLELVSLGSGSPAPEAGAVDPIDPEEEPLSPEVTEYPILEDAWRQSALADGYAATEWRERVADAVGAGAFGGDDRTNGDRVELAPVDEDAQSARPVDATIQRRGSLREYSHEPISQHLFATVLDRALRGVPTDAVDATDESRSPGQLIDCYCLVQSVEGINPGTYRYRPGENELERIGDTDRETAAHLALDQPVVGDAAANVYLMADVERVVERLGNRGYRLAQLEGGIALGRLYLATYAHSAIGGRGFTFYDDLVTDHLSPPDRDLQPMTLFAFGRPAE